MVDDLDGGPIGLDGGADGGLNGLDEGAADDTFSGPGDGFPGPDDDFSRPTDDFSGSDVVPVESTQSACVVAGGLELRGSLAPVFSTLQVNMCGPYHLYSLLSDPTAGVHAMFIRKVWLWRTNLQSSQRIRTCFNIGTCTIS